MKLGYSLRRRLMIWMVLVFAVGISTSGLFSYFEAYGTAKGLHKRTLQGQAQELLSGLRVASDGSVSVVLSPEWEEAYREPTGSYAYTLYDEHGRPLLVSSNSREPLPYGMGTGRHPDRRVSFVGPWDLVTLALQTDTGHTLVVGRRSADVEALAESLVEEEGEHLLVLVLFIVASFPLIWVITGWSLRPLARASAEAAAVGPTNPLLRIRADDLPREVQPLVDAVNGALERLGKAYEAERRLTADAAHALRTPLAVLNLRLEQARLHEAIDWSAIQGDLTQLNRLVNQLMDLASKEHRGRADDEARPVNLARVVREAAATVLPLADETGRPVEIEAPEAVTVRGCADDLRDMIRNLLDNALVHGRGRIHIVLREDDTTGARRAVLEVADEGPGVPEALKDKIFERFRKATATSPGAGLGLAVVQQVARAYGGDVRFLPGPRTCVQVALPISDPLKDESTCPQRPRTAPLGAAPN